MNSDTTASVLDGHHTRSHWRQPLRFPADESVLDFSVAIGTCAQTPAGATGQPLLVPNNSQYLFDPLKHTGIRSLKQLTADIQSCCSECLLHSRRTNTGTFAYSHSLRCSYYRVQDEWTKCSLHPGKFTQESVPTEKKKTPHREECLPHGWSKSQTGKKKATTIVAAHAWQISKGSQAIQSDVAWVPPRNWKILDARWTSNCWFSQKQGSSICLTGASAPYNIHFTPNWQRLPQIWKRWPWWGGTQLFATYVQRRHQSASNCRHNDLSCEGKEKGRIFPCTNYT